MKRDMCDLPERLSSARTPRGNDALMVPWPASKSARKSCNLPHMLNHFLMRDLNHMKATHMERRTDHEMERAAAQREQQDGCSDPSVERKKKNRLNH
jgi:hypothetical protein